MKKEYSKWISINEIFDINSVGIVSSRDKLTIRFSENEIKEIVNDFVKLPIEEARKKYNLVKDVRDWSVQMAQNDLKKSGLKDKNFKQIHYRPFDIRYTYYTGNSRGFQSMPRRTVMDNFINNNYALITSRIVKGNSFSHSFVSKKITNGALLATNTSSSSYVYPLYRYVEKGLYFNKEEAKRTLKEIENEFLELQKEYRNLLKEKQKNSLKLDELAQEEYNSLIEEKEILLEIKREQYEKAPKNAIDIQYEKLENINLKFRQFIDNKYNKKFSPEQILAYIYGILHSPTYREKYSDFLKIDFPRIPFCDSSEDFEKIAEVGQKLITVHLMEEIPDSDIAETYDGEVGKNTVERVKFQKVKNVGRVYINKTNYFEHIPKDIFEFYIGGYKVIEKYLKERKGKDLQIEEIQQVKNIAKILAFTMEKMEKLDELTKKTI